MDPRLIDSLRRLQAHFEHDERCLGMYLLGAIGRGETDAYSDVDVAVLVDDGDYEAVRAELPTLCATHCGPIVAWLPEGETEGFCNYAFLYRAGDDLLLYDLEIVSRSVFVRQMMRPDRVLFDRTGMLAAARDETLSVSHPPGGVDPLIRTYWVYAYLNGKYLRRNDLYKLLYVQQVLFQTHLRLLQNVFPASSGNWWARDVQSLPRVKREQMLVYFGARSMEDIRRALPQEMDLFSADATAACEHTGTAYSRPQEESVRRHLHRVGGIRFRKELSSSGA